VLAGIVVALVRGGVGSPSDDEAAAGLDALPTAGGAGVAATGGAARAADDAGSGGGGATASPGGALPLERVVRTADIRLRVRGDVAAAADRVAVLASSLGGFVTSSSTSSGGRSASADLTLRVPAARFDDARARLGRLGRVEATELAGEDVGGQLVDLDARLRSLRAEETALDALLARAGDIGQILQVRDRLTGVRTQVEQLAGQQAALQDRAALATIHVSMRRVGAPAGSSEDGSGFGHSVETAVDAFVAVVGGMAIVLGASLPFAALALLAWPLVRLVRRRYGVAAS
jgi:hypothetical protein